MSGETNIRNLSQQSAESQDKGRAGLLYDGRKRAARSTPRTTNFKVASRDWGQLYKTKVMTANGKLISDDHAANSGIMQTITCNCNAERIYSQENKAAFKNNKHTQPWEMRETFKYIDRAGQLK